MKITSNDITPTRFEQTQKKTSKTKFASKLQNTPIGKFVDGTIQDEKKIENAIKRLGRRKNMSQGELLKMQSLLYQYTQEVDLASKVVEKTASGFKQLMNIQV